MEGWVWASLGAVCRLSSLWFSQQVQSLRPELVVKFLQFPLFSATCLYPRDWCGTFRLRVASSRSWYFLWASKLIPFGRSMCPIVSEPGSAKKTASVWGSGPGRLDIPSPVFSFCLVLPVLTCPTPSFRNCWQVSWCPLLFFQNLETVNHKTCCH